MYLSLVQTSSCFMNYFQAQNIPIGSVLVVNGKDVSCVRDLVYK